MGLQILAFVTGACVGSFLAALTFRYPRRLSVLTGRSFCPNCKRKIAWFDNLPLLSYLVLRGRCRSCKRKISPRYPLIELSLGLGFLGISLSSLSFSSQLFYLFIFALLVLLFVMDLEQQILPDEFIFIALVVSISVSLLFGKEVFSNLFSGFVAASFLLCLHLLTRGRGMGLGDVKFAILGGFLLGPTFSLIWLFMSFLTGGLTGIILVLLGKVSLKQKIAFGPFLIISIFLTLAYGEKILVWLYPAPL